MTHKKITNKEEKELIELSEQGGWVSVGPIEEQRAYWEQVAQNTLKNS
ncbi:MAG: hypothetical protein ACI9VM_000923 [Candidatus Azotimanducaceae bacterium]|jgi:hypothetical protein